MSLISRLRLLTMLALLPLAAGCGAGGASGLYLSSDEANVAALQIVESDTHQLSGTLSFLSLNDAGRVETTTVAVTGASDAENITLTTGAAGLFSIQRGVSGTRRGSRIDLTVVSDGDALVWRLEKASLGQFQRHCENLRQRGQAIIDARSAQRQRQSVIALTQELQQTTRNDEAGVAEIARQSRPYGEATEAMRRWSVEHTSIGPHADAHASDRRAVLGDRIMSADEDVSARHYEMTAVRDGFEQHAQRLAASLQQASAACDRHQWAECADLNAAAQRYRTASAALRRAFRDAEAAYQAEAPQRQRIMASLNAG